MIFIHLQAHCQSHTSQHLFKALAKSLQKPALEFKIFLPPHRRNKISAPGLTNRKSTIAYLDNLLVTRQIKKAWPITRTV